MESQVLVTVGLPVYNGAQYLEETLESILAQDVESLELVVSDNGSTDTTAEILDKFSDGQRVRRFSRPDNVGAGWNFNRVLELAEGQFFHWSGHDDLMDPTMLRRCVEELEATDDAVLAYPRTVLIDGDGAETSEYDNRLNLS
jgi:glycosyltransferase involved in cell wall biosynthesis